MPWTTASQTSRTLWCPGQGDYPRKQPSHKAVRAAVKGDELHKLTYDLATGVDWNTAFKQLTHRGAKQVARKLANNRAFWQFVESFDAFELSCGFNCVDGSVKIIHGTFLQREERDRQFPGKEWITGTADFVAYVGRVWDLKTGKRIVPAKRNYQLLTLASILFKDRTDLDTVELGICQLTEPGEFELDTWVVGHEVLEKHRQCMMRAYTKYPLVKLGEQCRWCPSKQSCWNEQDNSESH